MKKIAIFASGTGSNAENLARAFADDLQICVDSLFCDRENAPVVEKMHRYGVPVFYFPKEVWRGDCKEIVELLQDRGIDLIVLAGFTSFVADCIVQAFDRRIINLHPSLLPKFGGKGMWGMNVHRAVIEAGEKESGITVHYLWDGVTFRPARIPERLMRDFMTVAESHDGSRVYLERVSTLLKDCQRVRVTSGEYSGIEGRLVRIRKTKRVMVALPGDIAVATGYIRPECMEEIL